MRGLHLAREKMIRLCHMAFEGLSRRTIHQYSISKGFQEGLLHNVHKATHGVHEVTKGCSHVNQRHLKPSKYANFLQTLSHYPIKEGVGSTNE